MEAKQDWSELSNQRPSLNNKRYIGGLNLLIFILMALLSAFILKNGAGAEYSRMIGWMGIAALAWCIVTMKILTGIYMSLPFMFEASFYVLTLGQSMLYAINGSIDHALNLYKSDNASNVNQAYVFTILCLLALNYGIILFYCNKRIRIVWGKKESFSAQPINYSNDYSQLMQRMGVLIAVVSAVPFAITWGKIIISYSISGYRNAYVNISGTTSWGKLFQIIGEFFPFALFMLLAACREERQKRNVVIAIIIILSILNFSIGNRSEPISYIVTVLWFLREQALSAKEKRRTGLFLLGGVLLLVLIVPVIGDTRNTGDLSLSSVISAITGKGSFFSTIGDTIVSMGWSAFPTIKTMQLIPEKFGYHYGQSYFFALLSVFPNVLGGTHISVKYAGLPQWLMNTLGMSYGPGYSAPAEAYYNFGWYGILIMPIIGYLAGKMLMNNKKDCSSMQLFVTMASFVVLFSFPRREMLTAIRSCAYHIGLLYLAVKIFDSKRRKSF